MAFNAYLSITGQKTGVVKGSVIQKGREGQIAVYAVQHEVVSPRDAGSGQATGKRQYKPLVITKEIDQASPVLHQLMTTNESLKEVKLNFYGPTKGVVSGAGVETLIYSIKLSNAAISRVTTIMENNKIEPGKTLPVLEEVVFVFGGIEWTWTAGGITSSDSLSIV